MVRDKQSRERCRSWTVFHAQCTSAPSCGFLILQANAEALDSWGGTTKHYLISPDFWATVCETVRPMLSVRCLSCLFVLSVCPVCHVRALWPNGLTDQDETRHAGRPRPWPHCVRWGPSSPPLKGHSPPQFSAHFYCGQTAACIKMPLGIELGLGPGDFVLDGDPVAPPQEGADPHNFGPCLL